MADKRNRFPNNPLNAVSRALTQSGWDHARKEKVITFYPLYEGECFAVTFAWIPDHGVLSYTCAIDLAVSSSVKEEIDKLLVEANERLYVGHLEYCPDLQAVIFRYGFFVVAGEPWKHTVLSIHSLGMEVCSTYTHAFKQVAAGKSAASVIVELIEVQGTNEVLDGEERPQRLHS